MTYVKKRYFTVWRRCVMSLLVFVAPLYAVEFGQPAPDFERADVKDQKIKLSNYIGKVVYLDFWASWCVPCRETFPFMNQLQEKFGKDGFEIVAVNIDTKSPDADKFLAQFPAVFTVLFDPQRARCDVLRVEGASDIVFDRSRPAI